MHDIKSASDAAHLIFFGGFLILFSFISRWVAFRFEGKQAPTDALPATEVAGGSSVPVARFVRNPASQPIETVGVGAGDSNAHA